MQRTYGVKNGAGTSVTEEDVLGAINPSSFGSAALIGVCERGDPGVAIPMTGPKQVQRKIGARLDDSLVRYGADDFWRYSEGAGKLYAVRVTDGNEVQSELTIYGRTTGAAYAEAVEDKPASAREIIEVLKVKAKDGGRWGGRRHVETLNGITISGNITETTITTGTTMKVNQYKGGYVLLVGTHNTSGTRQYEIVSNTTTTITVKTGLTMLTDLADGSVQSTCDVVIVLDRKVITTGRRKGVAVRFREGGLNPLTEFGLEVYLDGELVRSYENLSMDPTSPRYVEPVVNDDPANYEIEVTDLLASFTAITELNRPGNFSAQVKAITSTTVVFNPFRVKSNDAPTKLFPVSATYADSLLTGGTIRPERVTMVFTWDNTGKEFAVTIDSSEAPGLAVDSLPAFSVTTPAYSEEYDPGVPWLPTITVDMNADMAEGEKFEILCEPVNPDMVGGKVFPDVDGSQYSGFAIRDADYQTITVESGDPSSVGSAAAVAAVTGSQTGATFDTSTATGLKIKIDGRDPVTVTLTSGASTPIATIVSDINSAFDAVFGAGNLNPASAVGNAVVITSPGGFDGGGAGSSVEFMTVASDAYTLLGFTEGVTHGTDGTRARVEYLQDLVGGYDGDAPDVDDYLAAVSTATSPLNDIADDGAGNVMIAFPGITELLTASDVKTLYKQAIVYCESKPYLLFGEAPKSYDEASLIGFWNNDVGRSDMVAPFAPALGYIPDPDAASRTKLVSLLPMFMGLWAKFSTINEGYHKPAAGVAAKLYSVVDLPVDQKALDQELLTPVGINPLKYKGSGWIVWGARTLYTNSKWKQLSVRLQMNHVIHTMLDSYDWVIFLLNDKITWGQIKTVTREYLKKEWAKRVLKGDKEADAFTIKVDSDNNPQAQIDLGNAHLDLELNFNKFIERFKISIGAGGVSEVA